MTKNKVHVKIGGASYTIVTEDEAEYVEALADEISENMRAIINSNPSLSMTQAAVLVALDNADAADNLRAQIKDYLEDSARARMEVDVARREVERLNREISDLRDKLAAK